MDKSPFQIMYIKKPIKKLDLAPIPISNQFSVKGEELSKKIHELHQQVFQQSHNHNKQYVDHNNKHRKRVIYQKM